MKIGVSMRIVKAPNYNEKRDAISHDWSSILEKLEILPIFIPNRLTDLKKFLEEMKLDGIILSGGDNIGDDVLRDKTEKKIIQFGIERKIPILGVCRGMQMINSIQKGKVIKNSDSNHVGKNHKVFFSEDCSKILNSKSNMVNSFHNNIITKENLGKNLISFAQAEDKTVEGFYHNEFPIIGVMWHPEREPNKHNKRILKEFFTRKMFWKK
jgi:putative glutamine amidotransferase